MAVEPLGPVERDSAAGTDLGNCAGCWFVDSIAGNIIAIGAKDGEDESPTEGDAIRNGVELRVDIDIPAWVARERRVG